MFGGDQKDLCEKKTLDSNDLNICCICLDKEIDTILGCFHGYCQECIDEWRERDETCPLCREN